MRRLDDEDRVGDQYTKEQMDEICPRDSKGRFLKSTAVTKYLRSQYAKKVNAQKGAR